MKIATFCLVYGLALILVGVWAWTTSWAAGVDGVGCGLLVLAIGAGTSRLHTASRM